jgi:hypothetical protein
VLFRFRIIKLFQNKPLHLSLTSAIGGISVSLLLSANITHSNYSYVGLFITGIVWIFLVSLYPTTKIWIRHFRQDRFRRPIEIGILSGFVEETHQNPCPIEEGAKTPTEWQHFLVRNNFNATLIDPSQIDTRFVVIVNAFGEKYPEEDLARRKSFHRIKKYIEDGGIFLSTAGIPFYYMWDTRTGRPMITGESLEAIIPLPEQNDTMPIHFELTAVIEPSQTDFLHSWLRENFQIKTTAGLAEDLDVYQLESDIEIIGEIVSIGGLARVQEFRAALYGPNLIPLLRALKPANEPNEERYPIAASRFGLGYLVTVGMKPQGIGWFEKIGTTLIHLCEKVATEGSFELE